VGPAGAAVPLGGGTGLLSSHDSRTTPHVTKARPLSAHRDVRDPGWGRRGTSLMGQPAKRAGAKAFWIGLTGSSKLHNLLGNNSCTFVGAVSQLRRVARHSIGGAHRLDHLRAKAPIREAVRHQHFLLSPPWHAFAAGSSRIQSAFLLGRDTWATNQKKDRLRPFA
jgi:hypothetical protein